MFTTKIFSHLRQLYNISFEALSSDSIVVKMWEFEEEFDNNIKKLHSRKDYYLCKINNEYVWSRDINKSKVFNSEQHAILHMLEIGINNIDVEA